MAKPPPRPETPKESVPTPDLRDVGEALRRFPPRPKNKWEALQPRPGTNPIEEAILAQEREELRDIPRERLELFHRRASPDMILAWERCAQEGGPYLRDEHLLGHYFFHYLDDWGEARDYQGKAALLLQLPGPDIPGFVAFLMVFVHDWMPGYVEESPGLRQHPAVQRMVREVWSKQGNSGRAKLARLERLGDEKRRPRGRPREAPENQRLRWEYGALLNWMASFWKEHELRTQTQLGRELIWGEVQLPPYVSRAELDQCEGPAECARLVLAKCYGLSKKRVKNLLDQAAAEIRAQVKELEELSQRTEP